MQLAAKIFDVWVFRRRGTDVECLLMCTSVEKAARYFGGGRFWQIPSDFVQDEESVSEAIVRVLELRSVHEYVTGVEEPAKELCLYVAPAE